MGACATKPKVLKDGDEKPESPQPERPPQKEEEKVVKVAENDAALAPITSPTKNPSLGNLETEDAKASLGNESENENAINSFQENEAIKAPEVASENTKALEILPAPPATMADALVEKEVIIKAPGIIRQEDTEALPAPATMADVPVKKDANKSAEEAVNKEYTQVSEKLPTLAIEKMDSQVSEIVPEDYADALPAPASPVVADAPVEKLAVSAPEIVNKENANASENVKEMVGEKSVAESLEKIPIDKSPEIVSEK